MTRFAFLAASAALVPALVLAAPRAEATPNDSDPQARAARMEKRMRLARAIGLAEALDLDDAAALRMRDVLARYDEKRAPLRKQVSESMHVLRDAAHGDQAALGQVDQALSRAREARAQLYQLDGQMFDDIAKGLSPDRKAKAALFLATFRHRAGHVMLRTGPGGFGGKGGRRVMEMDDLPRVAPLPPLPRVEPPALTLGAPTEEFEMELDGDLDE
jgi:hypothetical protein